MVGNSNCVVIGYQTAPNLTSASGAGNNVIVIGNNAGAMSSGNSSVIIGNNTLYSAAGTSCATSVLIGAQTLYTQTGTTSVCTFVGYAAMNAWDGAITNSSAFGYGANVTGDSQVQLGNASTTTYVYGTVQNRSDARDKADIRDTQLGLDFIEALRPVDFRWDYRAHTLTLLSQRMKTAKAYPRMLNTPKTGVVNAAGTTTA
jgi:hypothetical protein